MARQLPTWDEVRRNARNYLSEARDELKSDLAPGTVITTEQVDAKLEVLRLIGEAKAALDRAS